MNDLFWKAAVVAGITLLATIVALLVVIIRRRTASGSRPDSERANGSLSAISEDACLSAVNKVKTVLMSFSEEYTLASEAPTESFNPAYRRLSQVCSEFGAVLGLHPRSKLDANLVALLDGFQAFFEQHAELWADWVACYEKEQTYAEKNSAGKVLIESAVRLALGDPFGKWREVQQDDREVQEDLVLLQKRAAALNGMQSGLIATLESVTDQLAGQYGWTLENEVSDGRPA